MRANCAFAPRVDNALRVVWHKQKNATTGFEGAGSAFDALVEALGEPSPQPLVCVNLMRGTMMSYPDSSDLLYHPDVVSLAAAAELAKVDLRIVVLHRDPRATVVSTAVNRDFVDIYTETQLMFNQLCILYAQLRAIDAKFYSCANYYSIAAEIDDIVTFIWHRPRREIVAKALHIVHFDKLVFDLTRVEHDLQRKAAPHDLDTRFMAFDRVYYTLFLPEICNTSQKKAPRASKTRAPHVAPRNPRAGNPAVRGRPGQH